MSTTTSKTSKTAAAPAAEATEQTWQNLLAAAAKKMDTAEKADKVASSLVWEGSQGAIAEFVSDSDSDPDGAEFYEAIKTILGDKRRGTANKIKTVAVAVATKGLNLAAHDSLRSAYNEALSLTKVAAAQTVEDAAGEEVVAAIAADAPKSTSKAEGAAAILLAKGFDEFARVVVDVVGPENTPALRSLLRAMSQEVAGRVQQVKEAEADAKAAEREAAALARAEEKAAKAAQAEKEGATKAKAPAKTKAPVKTAASKGKPVTKPKAEPAPVEDDDFDGLLDDEQPEPEAIDDSLTAQADETDDFDALLDEKTEPEPVPVKRAARPKGRPVVRR